MSRLDSALSALSLLRQRRPIEAKQHLEQGLATCPDSSPSDRQRLLRMSFDIHALLGDWTRAFADLDRAYRLSWPANAEPALWQGERLSKPLVVVANAMGDVIGLHILGGFGDTFLFARYLRSLSDRAGVEVILAVPAYMCKPLSRLFRQLVDISVVGSHELPDAGAWFPLELAPVYGNEPLFSDSVPTPRASTGLRVAVCWAGALRDRTGEQRTVPIDAWAPLFAVPDIEFVSVQQRRNVPSLWRALGVPYEPGIPPAGIQDLGPTLQDWNATADLLSAVDLVISSDTAVAHLAGLLRRPLWLLLHQDAGVFWEFGSRTRWYPRARLFRQARLGDWAPMMRQLADELRGRDPSRPLV